MSHKKGNAKHKKRCEVYRNFSIRERNKEIKLKRHVKNQPNDKQAKQALKEI